MPTTRSDRAPPCRQSWWWRPAIAANAATSCRTGGSINLKLTHKLGCGLLLPGHRVQPLPDRVLSHSRFPNPVAFGTEFERL
ncbi:protein of unknown function [Rhodovastum atsumiense]|nr:protein of unknown function [Rhodovastum atsumiense]